ncbi:hypothetical protein KCTC32516_02101 [Polaribacter huanghezhanensis]|nr:hypothetical protein [Polaribacter huanghezhanensis]WKD86723.1 hypothetical protein KCTC32516_02101 [Polaribacter huanghezhanensis]
MTTTNNLKEEKKENQVSSFYSKRVSWNSKRKHNYKYITSVF